MLAPYSINWIAVIVAIVVSMACGFLIYAPPVLGNWWMKQVGLNPQTVPKDAAMKSVAVALSLTAIMAISFAVIYAWTGAEGPLEGATVGLMCGLAFGLPIGMVHPTFEGRPLAVGVLYGAHHILEFVLIGLVFGFLA